MVNLTRYVVNIILMFFLTSTLGVAEEKSKDSELNIFTGLFDFSDDKQKAGLFGLQHQNDDLYRNSFLGKLSPITGGFLTENSALNHSLTQFPADFLLHARDDDGRLIVPFNLLD